MEPRELDPSGPVVQNTGLGPSLSALMGAPHRHNPTCDPGSWPWASSQLPPSLGSPCGVPGQRALSLLFCLIPCCWVVSAVRMTQHRCREAFITRPGRAHTAHSADSPLPARRLSKGSARLPGVRRSQDPPAWGERPRHGEGRGLAGDRGAGSKWGVRAEWWGGWGVAMPGCSRRLGPGLRAH